MSDWVELAAAYPPALEKLKSIRDQAGDRVRETVQVRESFNDFASINKYLNESTKTKDLFLWLNSSKPELAKSVFDLAKPALIVAKEYRVCSRYIEPESFERIRDVYREDERLAESSIVPDRRHDFAQKKFANQTATLVALLVLNDRKADAERIAAEALKERSDPAFKAELEKAQQGTVPAPWP